MSEVDKVAEQVQKTYLDDVTGEQVSKTELKRDKSKGPLKLEKLKRHQLLLKLLPNHPKRRTNLLI